MYYFGDKKGEMKNKNLLGRLYGFGRELILVLTIIQCPSDYR